MRPASRGVPVTLVLGVVDAGVFLSLEGHPLAQCLPFLLPAALAFWLAVRSTKRLPAKYRSVTGLVTVGSGLYLTANTAWCLFPLQTGRALPFPSVVDALFLASYALYGLFLVRWSGFWSRVDPRGSLDAVIISAGLSPLMWTVLLGGQPFTGTALGNATLLAYPTATLVLGTLALRLFFVVGTRSLLHILAFAWISLELVGDLAYAYTGVRGEFTFGEQPWQVAWVLSSAALGAMVLQTEKGPSHERWVARRPSARLRLPVLGAATFAPTVALVTGRHSGELQAYTLSVQALVITLLLLRLAALMVNLHEQQRAHAVLQRLSIELEEQANTDPLTALANRAALSRITDHALMQRPRQSDRRVALLVLDLDTFKAVNDRLGHDQGDLLLQEVADRLRSTCRSGDVIARLGGDEFVVLLEDTSLREAVHLSDRLVAALRAPVVLSRREVHTSASVGVAFADGGQTRDELMVQADTAMYAAKRAGGDQHAIFNAEQHRDVLAQHQLERDLRDALAQGQVHLHYQPIIDLSTGQVCGAEALMRWEHPERGAVSPNEFIPLAEAMGLIGALGSWALDEACGQLRAWDEAQPDLPPVRMAVNVSRRQFDGELTGRVRTALGEHGIAPERLLIEVTETALAGSSASLVHQLHELRDLGCVLAVDDFGTGYSALAELRDLPVHTLKIDRSFVAGIARTPEELAVTTAIVRLANSLQKTTLAEGVETGAQLAHVLALGCQQAQGWLFSKALTPEAFLQFRRAEPAYQPGRS